MRAAPLLLEVGPHAFGGGSGGDEDLCSCLSVVHSHHEGRSPEPLHQVPEVHQGHHLVGCGSVSGEGLIQRRMQLGRAIGEDGDTQRGLPDDQRLEVPGKPLGQSHASSWVIRPERTVLSASPPSSWKVRQAV